MSSSCVGGWDFGIGGRRRIGRFVRTSVSPRHRLVHAVLLAPLHAFAGSLPGVFGAFDRFKPGNLNIRLAREAEQVTFRMNISENVPFVRKKVSGIVVRRDVPPAGVVEVFEFGDDLPVILGGGFNEENRARSPDGGLGTFKDSCFQTFDVDLDQVTKFEFETVQLDHVDRFPFLKSLRVDDSEICDVSWIEQGQTDRIRMVPKCQLEGCDMQEVVNRNVRGQIIEDLALGFESENQTRRCHLVRERNRVGSQVCTDIDDNLARREDLRERDYLRLTPLSIEVQ